MHGVGGISDLVGGYLCDMGAVLCVLERMDAIIRIVGGEGVIFL